MRSKPTIFRQRKVSAMYVALAFAVLVVGALAAANSASWPRHALSESSSGVTAVPTFAAPVLPQTQSRLEAERITLRPTGFEPAEITRPAGRFLLAVNDRSGRESVTLLLHRSPGDLLNEVRMRDQRRKYEWRQVMNLPSGRYVLTELGRPDWVCRITLTSN